MDHLPALAAWDSFYVIVGSSSAALIGLQFVVIVLSAEGDVGGPDTTAAFATPTIVHFGAGLLVSAILSAPWPSMTGPDIALALCGLLGLLFVVRVVRQMRRQEHYEPVAEDWIWHVLLPAVAYLALLVAALALGRGPAWLLFVVAGSTLLFLFIGIHNAWDAVVYVAERQRRTRARKE